MMATFTMGQVDKTSTLLLFCANGMISYRKKAIKKKNVHIKIKTLDQKGGSLCTRRQSVF